MSAREFDSLAQGYQAFRPDYPLALVETAVRFALAGRTQDWPAVPDAIDVGSGTGISTRRLHDAAPGALRWTGIEPSEGMRDEAIEATPAALGITYIDGTAEALPFASASVALIAAAQAIQWFDRPRFYAEAARLLLPGGGLAVIQNNRDWQHSAFLDDYETFLETHGDRYTRHYRDLPLEDELQALVGFGDYQRHESRWTRPMSPGEFVGLCGSSTKGAAVIKRLGADAARAELLALAARHHPGIEQIPIDYVAELFLTRKGGR